MFTNALHTIESISAGLGILISFMALFSTMITGLTIIGKGQIYEKAGYASWKSVIPIYNQYILFKFVWGNGWIFLTLLIPIVNLVMIIITKYKLCRVFDCPSGTFIVLLFIPVIAYVMIAYSNSIEYEGDQRGNDIYYKPVQFETA